MSQPIQIGSANEFNNILKSSTIVVADFYADWCGPCKTIAPLYAQLSTQLSRPNKITFVKVNTETIQDVAQEYKVSALPTFIIFKSSTIVEKIRGADGPKLQAAVKKLVAEADSDGTGAGGFGSGSGGGPRWLPFPAPQGYTDVTDQVDVRGLDLLNSSSEGGGPRILFSGERPSGLVGEGKGKGKSAGGSGGKQEEEGKDWVESDTDEQLMLYIPFQSTLKVHTLHITSLPPKSPEGDGDGDEEIPMRPKNLRIYSNRANVLGFDEADGLPALQSVELRPEDWDEKTGSAKISLRFVKFQVVHSLILFVVDGEGEGEKVRVDRIRVVGETGEKRDPGKLEKVGEHDH